MSSEAQRGIEATRVNEVQAQNASRKGETTTEAEPAPTPMELAPEPVLEEVSAGISEDDVDIDHGVAAIEVTQKKM